MVGLIWTKLKRFVSRFTVKPKPEPRYEIVSGGIGIKCLVCSMTSFHPEDIEHKYCGNCHIFHDPYARIPKAVLEKYNQRAVDLELEIGKRRKERQNG